MAATDATRSSSSDASLFPEIEPYATGRLPLDTVHVMQWEACGNRDGVPLVFLHGGPGGGCLPHHRRFYDPAFWNIVLYDQRGAGRSTPAAELTDNTTQHLSPISRRLRERARDRALAGLRRVVGLDTGARVRAGASRPRARPRVARHFSRDRRRRSTGSCTACAMSFRRHGATFVEALPASEERVDLAGKLSSPAHRSRSDDAPARGAGVGPLRGHVHDAAARRGSARAGSTATPPHSPLRGSRRTTSSTRGFSRRTNCRTGWQRSATCPARSCRAATTSSVRR